MSENDQPISEVTFVLKSQNEVEIKFGEDGKEVFRCHGENDSFLNNKTEVVRFKWSKQDILETTVVNINCQEAAWKNFKNILDQQNNTVDSLVFEFKVAENPQNFNFPPPLPGNTISCKSLYPLILSMKPCIQSLHVDQIGYPYRLSTGFGELIQVKTAKKLWCAIAMKKEEVIRLEGSDISIDPLFF
ncbi:hypothetical protein L3Y34_014975 [Caenorhabditis briggsae]|uniref:Uncharacterized protein n=1 Tax=Caenorhabditis briggsae TaxID=6238 RepID=A0AAE9IZ41_CAEBR|nr:hypothetical protein L3Y34_014975 [Caenorhabditis briggsae]